MTQPISTFIVHGGAWDIPDQEVPGHLNGCRLAAQIGWSILQQGGSALNAVEAAIRSLEDDPVIDAGKGASATGWGESIMKVVLCKAACDYIARGHTAQPAADKAIAVLADRAQGLGGLIVIDRSGQIGVSFNTPRMARAWMQHDHIIARVDRNT